VLKFVPGSADALGDGVQSPTMKVGDNVAEIERKTG
jgi:hypothetical protein